MMVSEQVVCPLPSLHSLVSDLLPVNQLAHSGLQLCPQLGQPAVAHLQCIVGLLQGGVQLLTLLLLQGGGASLCGCCSD